MTTLHEQNNALQYKLVMEGLEAYRGMIRVADAETRREDAQFIADLEKIVGLAEQQTGYKSTTQRLRAKAARLKREIEEAGRRGREIKGIEVVINQYNGNTDVILPVKREDLTDKSNTFADKLYHCCEIACDEQGGAEERTLDGYIVFSLRSNTDKRTLAANILEEVPEELGGSSTGAMLYLRIASNFSFKYELDKVLSPESKQKLAMPSPIKRTLSREEAVEWFQEGKTAKELRDLFPDTPKMTLAGWASAFAKGQYE